MQSPHRTLTWQMFALIVLTDLVESVAELCLKSAVLATGIRQVTLATLGPFLSALLAHPVLWVGMGCFVLVFFLWMTVLTRLDLSVAFPIGSGLYLFVPLLAILVLHETVPPLRWAGTLCIIAGIWCVARSTEPPE